MIIKMEDITIGPKTNGLKNWIRFMSVKVASLK